METTACISTKIGLPKITLYAKAQSNTIKLAIKVFHYGMVPAVMGNLIIPVSVVPYPENP